MLDVQNLAQTNAPLPDEDVSELKIQRCVVVKQLEAIKLGLELGNDRDELESLAQHATAPIPNVRMRRKKLLAQLSAYDAVLAPHKRLPAELLSQIFVAAYPEAIFIPTHSRSSPLVISHVCSRWREVALGTAELWSDVVLRFSTHALLDPAQAIEVTREWFERSGTALISLVLVNQLSWPSKLTTRWDQGKLLQDVIDQLVLPLAHRLRRLQLPLPHSLLIPFFMARPAFSELQWLSLTLHPKSLPPLDTHFPLVLFNQDTTPRLSNVEFIEFDGGLPLKMLELPWASLTRLNFRQTRFPMEQCHALLKKCRQLEKCEFLVSQSDEPTSPPKIPLPCLHTLTVEFTRTAEDGVVGIFFEPLVAPSLKALGVTYPTRGDAGRAVDWGLDKFLKFLRQSDCKLETLQADLPFSYRNTQPNVLPDVDVIADALPSLVELQLQALLPTSLLCRVGQGNLLPRLKILIGHVGELQSVLDMLVARKERENLEGTVVIACPDYVVVDYQGANITPAQANLIDRLREKGVRIYVNRLD